MEPCLFLGDSEKEEREEEQSYEGELHDKNLYGNYFGASLGTGLAIIVIVLAVLFLHRSQRYGNSQGEFHKMEQMLVFLC